MSKTEFVTWNDLPLGEMCGPPTFRMWSVPQPSGTVLTSLGKDVITHAMSVGATAVLAEEVTMPDGRVLPVNTPMRQRPDGYWEVAE